jgi:putative ABC transport system permease protein
MNILTIPLSNIRRKCTKTVLLVLVFSLGVMSIVALHQVSLVVGESLEKKLSAYGANIIVSPRTEKLGVSYGGFHMGDMLYDVEDLGEKSSVAAIRSIALKDRISVIAPKLVTTFAIKKTPVAAVGVHWQDEFGIKSYWAIEGDIPKYPDDVIVGSRVAENMGVKAGDLLSIAEQSFRVSGILKETGGDDDRALFMDLSRLQQLLDKPDHVSFIEVAALCSGCPIDEIVTEMRAGLPGADIKALQSIVNQRMESVHFVQKLALSVSLVILVTAATMVALSMLSAVNERKKDIGILRTLGFGKVQIFVIFCLEAAVIGGAAGLVGYFSGYGASFKALELLALSSGFSPVFSFSHLFIAILFFGCITMLAAFYPAWKGATIEPSEALVAL